MKFFGSCLHHYFEGYLRRITKELQPSQKIFFSFAHKIINLYKFLIVFIQNYRFAVIVQMIE
jgi:hypothetical protein